VKPTIALVGGADVDRLLIKVTLGTADWQIVEAAGPEEALAAARTISPQLILLLALPTGLVGTFDVARACDFLRAHPQTGRARLVVLHEQSQRFAGDMNADVCFTRPFSPTALLNWIHAALGQTGSAFAG
jgi:CheY-like chemotaxis protein